MLQFALKKIIFYTLTETHANAQRKGLHFVVPRLVLKQTPLPNDKIVSMKRVEHARADGDESMFEAACICERVYVTDRVRQQELMQNSRITRKNYADLVEQWRTIDSEYQLEKAQIASVPWFFFWFAFP